MFLSCYTNFYKLYGFSMTFLLFVIVCLRYSRPVSFDSCCWGGLYLWDGFGWNGFDWMVFWIWLMGVDDCSKFDGVFEWVYWKKDGW